MRYVSFSACNMINTEWEEKAMTRGIFEHFENLPVTSLNKLCTQKFNSPSCVKLLTVFESFRCKSPPDDRFGKFNSASKSCPVIC